MKRVVFGVSVAVLYYLLAKNLTSVIDWQGEQISQHLQDELFPFVRLIPHESHQVESSAKPPPPQPIPIIPKPSTDAEQTVHNDSIGWPLITPLSGDAVRLSASATPIAIVSVPTSEALHLPTLSPTAMTTPQRS